eukprot:3187459-Rhodomonas_salina.1
MPFPYTLYEERRRIDLICPASVCCTGRKYPYYATVRYVQYYPIISAYGMSGTDLAYAPMRALQAETEAARALLAKTKAETRSELTHYPPK